MEKDMGEKEYLLSAGEMKRYDRNTIEYFGIPSLVLMERAALAVAEEIEARCGKGKKALVAAGCGNNGGDGIAAGRLLMQDGYDVDIWLAGDRAKCSRETAKQLEIIEKYGCQLQSKIGEGEYDIIVDALFGIGLSRNLEGIYAQAAEEINSRDAFVCAVDIPSGIHTDTGAVMGAAVEADLTVTFAFRKLGHILYPGCQYAGDVVCRQIGITEKSFLGNGPGVYTRQGPAARMLPDRDAGGNKGTFGKALVIAGSRDMSGACELCAKSVYRTGAGMVKVVTPEENRLVIQQKVPEALLMTYRMQGEGAIPCGRPGTENAERVRLPGRMPEGQENAEREEQPGGMPGRQENAKRAKMPEGRENTEKTVLHEGMPGREGNAENPGIMEGQDENGNETDGRKRPASELAGRMRQAYKWADVIVIGPGLGLSETARELLAWSVMHTQKPLVIDADGINLLAKDKALQKYLEEHAGDGRAIVMTPHVGEFSRLYGGTVAEVKGSLLPMAKELADRYGCVMVAKNARTVVASSRKEGLYLNTTGNDGMATAGMGDVLAGIIGGLLAQGMEAGEAAEAGVYIHGAAGDAAAREIGRYGLMAGDVVNALPCCIH